MNHNSVTFKRMFIYVLGLFFIALGVTFSIMTKLGVSPVSSLPYALSLILPISVGVSTIIANFLFIVLQVIFTKEFNLKESIVQCLISFIFGFFIDFTLWLTQALPTAHSLFIIIVYIIISLILVALGLLFYFTAKLPMMPYDSLTAVISSKWKMPMGKAKITSDMTNVVFSLVVSLVFIHSFGSIGIGTIIAAYGIGKIVGIFIAKFQPTIKEWVFETKDLKI